MQAAEVSLARTEDLGIHQENHDNDEIWLVDSSEPSNQQLLSSSSSSDDDDVVDDSQHEEDARKEKEHANSKLTNDDIYVEINVVPAGQIYVPAAQLNSFLEKVNVERRSLPVP